MQGFFQYPWLSDEDAALLKDWYRSDPAAAKRYLDHLHEEARSDERFRDITVPLDALGDAA